MYLSFWTSASQTACATPAETLLSWTLLCFGFLSVDIQLLSKAAMISPHKFVNAKIVVSTTRVDVLVTT